MHGLFRATLMVLALCLIGCSGRSAIAPDAGPAARLTGALPPTVALFDLHVDPDSLSAELTPVRTGTAQPPQNLTFDLEVGKFLSPATLQVAGIQLSHYQDAIVQIRHRHPFSAPDLTSGINARNRADLGYTGRLFALTQASSQSFPGGINLDPWTIREPDGYASVGDLLRDATGLTHTHFPYMLLVDEAKNNREGVSNGASASGSYVAATGGWQRGNLGPDGTGWTGFDYLHGGQSSLINLTLRRGSLLAANWNIRLAVIIQYTDPRGLADLSRRLPMNPTDVTQFAYRLPYAALDVSRLTGVWDTTLNPNPGTTRTLTATLRDWDAEAAASGDNNLSDEPDVSKVQPGGAGVPTLTLDLPAVIGAAMTLTPSSGSGEAGDEFRYNAQVGNTMGAAPGIYWGLLRATDPESADGTRGSYHFGVDGETLAADPIRRLDPVTIHPVRITVPESTTGWITSWGDFRVDGARFLAVGPTGQIAAAGLANNGAFDPRPDDPRQGFVWGGNSDIYISLFDSTGEFAGSLIFGGAGDDSITQMASDTDGNLICLLRTRSVTIDFDPGPGVFNPGSNGSLAMTVLAKYSPAGQLLWARTLSVPTGSTNNHNELAVGPDDAIYLAGNFSGTRDFDPGPGTVNVTSNGAGANADQYLWKITAAGDLGWVRTWDNASALFDRLESIVPTDSGIVVAGKLSTVEPFGQGFIDLDPTAGVAQRRGHEYGVPFFARLDSNGAYQSGEAWLSDYRDPGDPEAYGQLGAVTLDSAGNLYAVGGYDGYGDRDPGPGENLFDTLGDPGGWVFFTKFNAANELQWVFDLPSYDSSLSTAGQVWLASDDHLYWSGAIATDIDFDPGAGTATVVKGPEDTTCYVSYTTDGAFRLAKSWDSSYASNIAYAIEETPDGRVIVVGSADPGTDLDPGTGTRLFSTLGDADAYIINLSLEGDW